MKQRITSSWRFSTKRGWMLPLWMPCAWPRSNWGSPSAQSEEEKQWVLAQAIGQHLQLTLLERLGIEPEGRRPLLGESLPRLLGSRLLVPGTWLRADARGAGYDLLALKQLYTTASHELIAWRLLDLDEPCVITIVDNDHVSRRRSNVYSVRKQLEEPERRCQQYVHRYSRPHLVRLDAWTVQGWPIHHPDWKREILRSVVDD
jgi:hypothetical protein